MQVSEFTEDHPYWGTLRQSQVYDLNPKTVDAADTSRQQRDRALVHNIDDGTKAVPKADQSERKARGRRQKGMSVACRSRGKAREKRFGVADPVVWDAINRSLAQQRRLSTIIMPEEATVEPVQLLEVPSRTSSRRKALNRFTRQLEKYADAAGAASKAPVMTPTESESKVSYHTVQPLLPYKKEFQAAGLAVTSAEQSRRPPIKSRHHHMPVNCPIEEEDSPEQISGDLDGPGDTLSEQSSCSSGSFVEFTPEDQPIEQLPIPKSKSKQKCQPEEKSGIFPWLRKRRPTRETRTSQLGPQQAWLITKNGNVESRVKHIDTLNPRGLRHSSPLRGPSSRAPVTVPPVTHLRRSMKSSANVINSKRQPEATPPSVKNTEADHRLRSRPGALRTGPDPETRQQIVHTGLRKREPAVRRLPCPETIKEEKETSPIHPDQTKVQTHPEAESKDEPIVSTVTNERPRCLTPQTTPSTVPSLPYPAQYASGRPSSLERALEEVSQQLDKMEQEADRSTQLYTRPPTLVEKTDQKEKQDKPYRSDQKAHRNGLSRRPGKNEEVIFSNRKMPTVESLKLEPEPEPAPEPEPEPEPELEPEPEPRQESTPQLKSPQPLKPIQGALATLTKGSTIGSKEGKALPKTPSTNDILKDLDVFFGYEDGDINDRDVIRGLQVADSRGDQHAEERRAESRRLWRIQNGKMLHLSGS
ncbi:hypothetical protein GGR54DRAFT_630843 [Hypoxylon sp. NC1633]|nr:hypothetical protein GGR54DRAFT_630843 [Hypoxylon sp. NC1633]